MKNYSRIMYLFVCLWLLEGCQSNVKNQVPESIQTEQKDSADTITSEKNATESKETAIAEQVLAKDEIRGFGKIVNIEDGAYPMFVVTIDFSEKQVQHHFNLNIESISLSPAQLNHLNGKYVTFHYKNDLKNNLRDLHYNGTSLLGKYAPEANPEWKRVVGILAGAEAETQSDLPDEISITDATGKQFQFEYYIDLEMVSANGKTVTVFYSLRSMETITYIQVAED